MRERQDKRRASLFLLVVLTVVLVFGQAIQSTYADSELDLNKTDVQISTPDTSKADNTNKDELNQDNEDQLKEKDVQLDLSNSRVVKDSSDISLNNISRKRVTRAIAEIEKIDISVKAEWNAPYHPPITVNLMANGEQKDSVVLRYGKYRMMNPTGDMFLEIFLSTMMMVTKSNIL